MKFLKILGEMLNEMGHQPDNGDCFDSAFDFMLDKGNEIEGLKLVHGFVSGKGELNGYRFAHGWCEDNEIVYDNANGKKGALPKMIYYGIGNIHPDDCKYYSFDETIDMAQNFNHKGPWEIKNKVYKEKFNSKTGRYNQ
jgi:hypothetical protein